ncbi:MAG: choice-of-anchor D domain-containing protein, partial [Sedimenticola sp.]
VATVSIANDDSDENPYTFSIAGTGTTAPEIDVQRPASTSIADEGTDAQDNKNVGDQVTLTYTVENTGNGVLNVTDITSANPSNVTVDSISTTAFTVGAGATATFNVLYTPTTAGAFSFDLDITSDDADEGNYDLTVSGTGTGTTAPEIDLQRPASTSIADDGTDAQGSKNAGDQVTLTYTVENTGNAVLNVTNITSTGASNVTVDSISTTAFTVGAGATATFNVLYTPTAAGAFSFDLDITSDDADEANYDIAVSGTGATAPEIDLQRPASSSIADPGTDAQGSKNASDQVTLTYTVENTGNAVLNVTNITSTGASNVTVDSISTTAFTVGAGATATFNVLYTPTAAGAFSFALDITSDDTNEGNYDLTVSGSSGPDEAETVATTQQAIQNFAGKRMVMITSQGPGLSGFLGGDGLGGGFNGFFGDSPVGLNFSGDSDRNQGSFSTSLQQFINAEQRAYARKLAQNGAAEGGGVPGESQSPIRSPANIWIKGRWTHAKEDRGNIDEKSDFGIVYIGTDWRHSKDLLIGLMGQIDWADEKSTGLNIEAEGKGWMLGPYVVSRLTDTLILDLRGAWGQSDNKVNPLGTYWDSYDSERWQIEGNLTGSFDHDRWHVAPSLGWNYFEEKQKAYTDNNGFRIGEQTASLGSLNFGPTASYTLRETDDGLLIRPLVGLKGVWDFDAPDITAVNGLAVGTEGLRAQLKVGINLRTVKGLTFQGSYTYDGIGVSDFESHTAELSLSMLLRSSALPKGSSIQGSYSLQGINYLNSFEQRSEDAQRAKLSIDIPF